MNQILSSTISPRRFNTLLMEGFAGAGLLLAMIGLYAVLSSLVEQRRYEIGVRIALGARRRDILRWVIARGLKLAFAGSAIGLVASLGLAHAIAGMLYKTETFEPVIYLSMFLLLLALTAAASYIPAARAAKTDPMKTFQDT
jgi:ABC-type antimicrobial peptide transport system permease subunit